MSTTWTQAPFIQIIDGTVPVEEEGTCDPGWGPSWAQWAVPVTGGPVCNRVVFWNEAPAFLKYSVPDKHVWAWPICTYWLSSSKR